MLDRSHISRLFAGPVPWAHLAPAAQAPDSYTADSVRDLLARTSASELSPDPLRVGEVKRILSWPPAKVSACAERGTLAALRGHGEHWRIPVVSVQGLIQESLRPRGCRITVGGASMTVVDYEATAAGLYLRAQTTTGQRRLVPAHLTFAGPVPAQTR